MPFPTIAERVRTATTEYSRTLESIRETLNYRINDGKITSASLDDDLIRYLDTQLPELLKLNTRIRALRDAELGTKS